MAGMADGARTGDYAHTGRFLSRLRGQGRLPSAPVTTAFDSYDNRRRRLSMDELRKGQADARGAARAEPPGRILIIRPSALGDVCRTVPVLASLRRAYPEAKIDWVVRDSFLAGIAAHPALHEAIPFPRGRFARWWRSPAVGCEVYRWFRGLRRRRYDLVFDCQGLGRSGLIAWATGAARRVGFRSAREFAWLGYNVRVPAAAPHTVDAMLSLLDGQGIATVADMRLYVADEDRRWWSRRREELRFGERSYAVLAPTARWPSKRWPIERWRAVAGALPEMGCERVVVIGAPGERDQVVGIEPKAPSARAALVDLVGETSVGQTMAVIAAAIKKSVGGIHSLILLSIFLILVFNSSYQM